MNLSRIIFLFFLSFAAEKIVAQQGPTIQSAIDKNKILIGEPIHLAVEIRLPASPVISSFNLDSIPHFEILEPAVIDTSYENGNTVIKAFYTITSFDSGHWVIPSFFLNPAVRSDSLPVDVVFSDFDPNQDYHDIKDIIPVKPKKTSGWWLYAIAGGLLVIVVLIYFLRKKKPAPVVKPVVSLNAYEEAMKELEQLKRSKTDAKMFHSGLTNIFRLYVYRKKGILSLQKTTDNLVLQLKDLDLEKEQFDKLAQSLRLSDFVKFAKYVPSSEDDMAAFDTIRNSIINLEKSGTNSPSPGGS